MVRSLTELAAAEIDFPEISSDKLFGSIRIPVDSVEMFAEHAPFFDNMVLINELFSCQLIASIILRKLKDMAQGDILIGTKIKPDDLCLAFNHISEAMKNLDSATKDAIEK